MKTNPQNRVNAFGLEREDYRLDEEQKHPFQPEKQEPDWKNREKSFNQDVRRSRSRSRRMRSSVLSTTEIPIG
jgi:hypothetical protein